MSKEKLKELAFNEFIKLLKREKNKFIEKIEIENDKIFIKINFQVEYCINDLKEIELFNQLKNNLDKNV